MRTLAGVLMVAGGLITNTSHAAWERHTIDDTSEGADGVRLFDANGDGLQDIATAWEEGGVVRVYLHPGFNKVKGPWPKVTVGSVRNGEDAVLTDMDGDGAVDVISATEGDTQTLFVHWAPKGKARYLDPEAWTTEAIPDSVGKTRWMFSCPINPGEGQPQIVVAGSKNPNGQLGYYAVPPDARALDQWEWHKVYDTGWIMSIQASVPPDGDPVALLVSNRRPPNPGCFYFLRTEEGLSNENAWTRKPISEAPHEWMFLDGFQPVQETGEVVCATSGDSPMLLDSTGAPPRELRLPPGLGTGKGVAMGHFGGGEELDLAYSCEKSEGKIGVIVLLDYEVQPEGGVPPFIDVSGTEGAKFDRIEVIDLDGDGDLDIMTCEERESLGVIWYENPGWPQ